MKENNFKFKRKLTIGETIKINGVPVKYLGNDDIGSNTDFVDIDVLRHTISKIKGQSNIEVTEVCSLCGKSADIQELESKHYYCYSCTS